MYDEDEEAQIVPSFGGAGPSGDAGGQLIA